MKDWKTYALILLAAWCAALTFGDRRAASALPAASGSPTDCTDSPPVIDRDGASLSWTADGDGGLALDCYCRVSPTNGWATLQRCRLSFSEDGRLAKAELLPDRACLLAGLFGDDEKITFKSPRHGTASRKDRPASRQPLGLDE